MTSIINTNLASLNTQNNLSKSQSALNTAIQRLSSGLRVNGAKDDAAGMAIATRMESTIKGQTVAQRNANDGISYSQVAEGTLTQVGDNLQRMRELAVQAANGTNGTSDMAALNTEFQQLQAEVSRISNNTMFNGINVLSGGTITFQVGAGTTNNDRISIGAGDLTSATSETSKITAKGTASQLSVAKQGLTDVGGVVTYSITTGQASIAGATTAQTAATTAYNLALSRSALGIDLAAGATATFAAATGVATLPLPGTSGLSATALAADLLTYTNEQGGGAGFSITTQGTAKATLDQIDKALTEVNTEAIKHGAIQNRFAIAIANLQTSTENQNAAMSRIMDTDYAAETGVMARSQILQQAGMAMLAQANQLPNGVMALMR